MLLKSLWNDRTRGSSDMTRVSCGTTADIQLECVGGSDAKPRRIQ